MFLINRQVYARITHPGLRFSSSTIKDLQSAFKDPRSLFHIAPGTQGPAEPDEPFNPVEEGHEKLTSLGYDPTSFWEQSIVWGDHDAFQHVNNVRYVRFFESGRIKWMTSLGMELGGPAKAQEMIKAQGVSLILKSISVDYKRPVTYPDTLLIAHKPAYLPARSPPGAHSRTAFSVLATAYSYTQRAIVAESDSVLVWYDYPNLRKCDPGNRAWQILDSRIRARH